MLESVKRVTLFRTSISRDVRTVLYAGSRVSERLSAMCPIDLETFPFWVQPVIRLWLVVDDDTSMHL